jgi:hypothetical protein
VLLHLHQPAILLRQNEKPFDRDPPRSLSVASRSFDLFFTSGLHRLGGFCRSRQSWGRPNGTQSATSNCNTHDPVSGNSETPQAAPGSPTATACGAWMFGCGAKSASRLGTYFFRKWGRGGRGPGAGPGVPQPISWPTAAPGGAGREGGALHRLCSWLVGFWPAAALVMCTKCRRFRCSCALVPYQSPFAQVASEKSWQSESPRYIVLT